MRLSGPGARRLGPQDPIPFDVQWSVKGGVVPIQYVDGVPLGGLLIGREPEIDARSPGRQHEHVVVQSTDLRRHAPRGKNVDCGPATAAVSTVSASEPLVRLLLVLPDPHDGHQVAVWKSDETGLAKTLQAAWRIVRDGDGRQILPVTALIAGNHGHDGPSFVATVFETHQAQPCTAVDDQDVAEPVDRGP